MLRTRILFASLLFAGACSVAQADQVVAPSIASRIAIAIAPAKVRAPYDVQVMREDGETLPTYALRDRFYVQGNANERYIIRVTNPTARRIEAVVSVDGLDVVDGESGDLRKRGYVVPPYGEVRIEGFRTSSDDVATFRFSAVSDSYAGKKGKARNVGVIAVALFEEEASVYEQQILVEPPPPPNYRQPYDGEDDLDASASRATRGGGGRGVASADKAPAKSDSYREGVAAKRMAPRAEATSTTSAPAVGAAPTGMAPRARLDRNGDEAEAGVSRHESEAPRSRPGLGTEFGEQRYSAASFTKFVRAPGRPIAIAELRYNDAPGLMALGINVTPLPDSGELMTRETADPFPGDGRFATPPMR